LVCIGVTTWQILYFPSPCATRKSKKKKRHAEKLRCEVASLHDAQQNQTNDLDAEGGDRQTVSGAGLEVVAQLLAVRDAFGATVVKADRHVRPTAVVLVPDRRHARPRDQGEHNVQHRQHVQRDLRLDADEEQATQDRRNARRQGGNNVERLGHLEQVRGLLALHIRRSVVVVVLAAVILQTPHRHTRQLTATHRRAVRRRLQTPAAELRHGGRRHDEQEHHAGAQHVQCYVQLAAESFESHGCGGE
jgi:hypothetical protein